MMEEEIKNTIEVLEAGGTVVYPTDTVWGVGCDATNPKAVNKINKLKKRLKSKNLIVLIDSEKKLENYVEDVPDIVFDLIENIEKPLTIIYPKAKNLAKNLIAKDGSIAIRITKDEFSKKVAQKFNKPIVSTSANLSGEPSPISFKKIPKEIIENADYIVNIFHDTINEIKPSTIIKFNDNNVFTIIRE